MGQVWEEDNDFTDSSVLYPSGNVDLKEIDGQICLQQNEIIWEQQWIAIWDMGSNGEPGTSPEKKKEEEKNSIMDLVGAVVNKEFIWGNWKFKA